MVLVYLSVFVFARRAKNENKKKDKVPLRIITLEHRVVSRIGEVRAKSDKYLINT